MKHKLYSITIDGVQYNVTKASTEFVCVECHLREICEEDFTDRTDVNHTICNLCSEFTEDDYCFKKARTNE